MNDLNTPFHARQPHCHETVAEPSNPAASGMVLYPMDIVWLIFVFWAVLCALIIHFNLNEDGIQ